MSRHVDNSYGTPVLPAGMGEVEYDGDFLQNSQFCLLRFFTSDYVELQKSHTCGFLCVIKGRILTYNLSAVNELSVDEVSVDSLS